MTDVNDIVIKINETGDCKHFLASRKQLIDSLIANDDIATLRHLLKEDMANLNELKLILKKTGEHISNIKMLAQYNI